MLCRLYDVAIVYFVGTSDLGIGTCGSALPLFSAPLPARTLSWKLSRCSSHMPFITSALRISWCVCTCACISKILIFQVRLLLCDIYDCESCPRWKVCGVGANYIQALVIGHTLEIFLNNEQRCDDRHRGLGWALMQRYPERGRGLAHEQFANETSQAFENVLHDNPLS